MGRLVINGDEIYELDEECLKEKRKKNTLKNVSVLSISFPSKPTCSKSSHAS